MMRMPAPMAVMSVMFMIPMLPAFRRDGLSPQLRGQPLAAAAARRGQIAAPGALIAFRPLF